VKEETSLYFPKNISNYCPPSIDKTVKRENAINTIKHYLKANSVIIVEGDFSIGKTTFLAQLSEYEFKDSIVFFSTERKAKFLNDSAICNDLFLQVSVFMGEDVDDFDHEKVVSFDDLSKKFNSLKYYLKIKRKKVIFILDDLLNIEGLDDNFVANLFLIMPFDSNAKFIISVKGEFFGKYIPLENRQKFTLPVLDLIEIAKIIPDASNKQVHLIMQTFGGMPDRISTFARLIDNGKSIEDLLNETDDSEDSLYSIEWNIAVQSKDHEHAVAFVAFSFHDLNFVDLGHLLNLDSEKTKKLINEISFLKLDNEVLKLSSQRFISFAKNRLSELRLHCIDTLIEYFDLLGDEKQNLPETIRYIEAKGDNQGVVDHIDDNHILGLYQNTSSFSEVNRTIKIGIKAALGLHDDNSITKLSHLNCAFANINKSKVIVSELNCHLTEGDNVKALELIEANGSNEEKLQLYCLYCISQKKNKNDVEKEVLDKIEFLYQKFANKNLGVEKATDIAADLLPVFPDKALKIINNLDELESAGQNKSDAAFYKMSILTLRRHGDALGDDLSQLATLDDKRTEMFNSVEVFSPDSPSEKIINHVSKMQEMGDRIFIYRSWLKNNYKRKAAIPILTELLKLSIETTDFSIDASLYADATKCLTIADISNHLYAYEKIVTHLGTLKDKGPTIEYVKLVVNLCHCEKNNSIQSNNIGELIDYLLSLSDKSVALTGLTIVSLRIIELGRSDLIHLLKQNKNEIFEVLLNSDAYHIDVFKDAIANEAVYDFDNSLIWCSRLNTQSRKNKAYSIAIDNFICREGKSKQMNFEFFLMCVRKIQDENYKEDVYELVVKYYYENYASNNNFKKFFKFLDKIKSNLVKSKCLIKSISGEIKRAEHSQKHKITETLLIAINESILKTDSLDNQINLYFLAHKELYPIARDFAIKFKHSAQKIKNEYKIATSDLNDYLFSSIDLAIRCIYQLEEYNQTTHEDVEFIIGKIIMLPSNIDKSYLFARIASALQKRGAGEKANLIIERNILPILNEYEDKESKEYAMCCLHSLPVVFVYDYLIFEPLLSNISELYQTIHEKIIKNCSLYVLRDCIITDPYSPPPKKKYTLIKHKEFNSLVKLISKAKEDNTILFESRQIIDALSAAKRANDVNNLQVESIIGEIKKFYDRFPIRGGIQHDGYKIILKCYIKKFNDKSETDTWDQIINAAKQVNNTSDRCFMLAEIASNLPDKLTQKRHALFTQSETLISNLSSNLEKLNRYSSLCENSLEKDKGLSKKYLKKALELCGNDSDSKQARLAFIDMINRYDDSFSSSLVNMFDADPARKKAIDKSIKNKKEQDELERKFNTNELDYDDHDLAYSKKVSHLAWENLGILNAKSASFKKGFDIKNLLSGKHDFSINVYYRLFSYYIHYLAHVNSGKENRQNFIRPILSLISSNIVTVARVYTKLESSNPSVKTKNTSDFMTVKEGDKSRSELFLRKWFQKRESNQLTIIDPYIDLESIHLLSQIIEQDPEINLTIISSMKARETLLNNNFDRIDESIFDFWHSNIGKGELPSFKFVFIHYGTNKKFPFHDRYLYTPDSMLSVGTSLNGLGARQSQISVLEENEMLSVLGMVEPILTENQRFYQGERIKISGESF
jgi:hypothetical protein